MKFMFVLYQLSRFMFNMQCFCNCFILCNSSIFSEVLSLGEEKRKIQNRGLGIPEITQSPLGTDKVTFKYTR